MTNPYQLNPYQQTFRNTAYEDNVWRMLGPQTNRGVQASHLIPDGLWGDQTVENAYSNPLAQKFRSHILNGDVDAWRAFEGEVDTRYPYVKDKYKRFYEDLTGYTDGPGYMMNENSRVDFQQSLLDDFLSGELEQARVLDDRDAIQAAKYASAQDASLAGRLKSRNAYMRSMPEYAAQDARAAAIMQAYSSGANGLNQERSTSIFNALVDAARPTASAMPVESVVQAAVPVAQVAKSPTFMGRIAKGISRFF